MAHAPFSRRQASLLLAAAPFGIVLTRGARALAADLARFSGVVPAHSRHAGGGRLEDLEAFFLGDAWANAAEHAHGVLLLEALECAGSRLGFDAGEARNRDELAARRLDLEIEERPDGFTTGVADLRDDFVAAVEIVEPVDVAATE